MDEPIFDIFAFLLGQANAPIKTASGVGKVEFIINSQNLPTIKITTSEGIIFQIVFWSNNRLILQKIENDVTTNLTTWTGS